MLISPKLRQLFLIWVILVSFATMSMGYSGGSGTQASPYQIATANDLIQLGNTTADYSKYFIMTADIDLAGRVFDKAVIAWDTDTDIAFDGVKFTGKFNGSGHLIKNLTITNTKAYYCGLFGYVGAGGIISNIILSNVKVEGGERVGSLAGYSYSGSVIDNCTATVLVSGYEYIGGLVGNSSGNISNCIVKGSMNGSSLTGGIAGGYSGQKMYNCHTEVTVKNSQDYAGGLIGSGAAIEIANCSATGKISGGNYTGGLIGISSSTELISNCKASVELSGNNYLGGFCGQNYGNITNCYAKGSIVSGNYYTGGFCGYASRSIIKYCYASVKNATNRYYSGIGGFLGYNESSTITGCVVDQEQSNLNTVVESGSSSGIFIKNTTDMKFISTYTSIGWDFSDTDGDINDWKINGFDYPVLAWEIEDLVTVPDISGLTDEQATQQLNSLGFNFGEFEYFCDTVPSGETSQMPAAGSGQKIGSTVYMAKSLGSKYAGSGTEADPYQIATAEHLVGFGLSIEDYGKCISLTADIDLAGRQFNRAIIAYNRISSTNYIGTYFSGIFNGNGHSIRNMNISGEYYCGLFGVIRSGAKISDLIVDNCHITAYNDNIGGLCGSNSGDISKCIVNGTVSGNNNIGIICGNNHGSISNCFTSGLASGKGCIGGICGNFDNGNIISCFTTGVTRGNGYYVGGVCGYKSYYDSNILYCYFYEYNAYDNGIGIKLDDAKMQNKSSYTGFDFAGDESDGTEDIWVMEDGYLPRLNWQLSPGYPVPNLRIDSGTTLQGRGYLGDPFLISNLEDILEFRTNSKLRGGYYQMTDDIDLSGETYNYAFIPEVFTGHFNGNGHIISGLTVVGGDYLGLFEIIMGGTVEKLGLRNLNITGTIYSGGICGYNYAGNIKNCYVDGLLSGLSYVGGICGLNYGKISCCYSTADISGTYSIGGLCGSGNNSSVSNSYFYQYGGPDNKKGTSLSDEQLLNRESYIGFDFADDSTDGTEDIWTIVNGYLPQFSCQTSPGLTSPNRLEAVETSLMGSGTITDPFIISDIANMLEFQSNNNLRFGNYRLDADIDLSGIVYDMAFISRGFSGNFIGNNHIISGLTLTGNYDLGMFYNLTGGSVDGLTLNNLTIQGGGNLGGISVMNEGRISNCIVNCKISGTGSYVGGICAKNMGEISRCKVIGTISSVYMVGGFIGINDVGKISDSSASVTVTGDGGCFAGVNDYNGIIERCYSAGTISGKSVGGFCGGVAGKIYNCYSSCIVNGSTDSGGFFAVDITSEITNCYSQGAVCGGYSGGFGGRMGNGKITNCYSSCYIGNSNYRGGFFGSTGNTSCTLSGCFWNVPMSGTGKGVGSVGYISPTITGLYSDKMMIKNTFTDAGWDFVTSDGDAADWKMSESHGYPVLAWQTEYNGDVAGDEIVDIADLEKLVANWLCETDVADFDGNTLVDINDFGLMANNWLNETPSFFGPSFMTARWSLDETSGNVAADMSDPKNNGVVYGSPAYDAGVKDGCYVFDGINDHVVSEGCRGIAGGASRTVCAYIKGSKNKYGVIRTIVSWGSSVSGGYAKWFVALDDATGQLALGIYGARIKGGPDLMDNQWHHVAVVLPTGATNINKVKLYVDGMEVTTNAGSLNATINTALSEVTIGATNTSTTVGVYTPDQYFNGNIDDVRIYNRELSGYEISEIAGVRYYNNRDVLVGYWKFDETFGKKPKDSSVYGNSGLVMVNSNNHYFGIRNLCYGFGTNLYVSVPGVIIPSAGPFSASLWAKGGSGSQNLICQTDGNGIGYPWLALSNGKVMTSLQDSLGSSIISSKTWESTSWHHVVLVWDGARRHVYVDGVIEVEDQANINQPDFSNGQIYIGANKSLSTTSFWNGLIDEVRLYKKVLTIDEIDELGNITPSLIACLPLNETADKIAINIDYTKNGTVYGSPAYGTGIDGGCYVLDGVDDYVSVPLVLTPDAGPFTACLWAKGGVTGQSIICQTDGTGTGRIWLGLSDNKIRTALGGVSMASSIAWDSTNWHHVAFIWDGARRHIYVDGVIAVEDTVDMGGPLEFADGPIYIGTHKGLGAGTFWKGSLDDVRIYNKALSSQEITDLAGY